MRLQGSNHYLLLCSNNNMTVPTVKLFLHRLSQDEQSHGTPSFIQPTPDEPL